MDKLIFNGIASNNFEMCSTTSFSLKINETWIVVDMGPDTPKQIKKSGLKFIDIDYIILTHRHLDHCLGLPYFLFGRRLEILAQKKKNSEYIAPKLKIIGEIDLWEKCLDFFKFCHPDATHLLYEIEIFDISKNVNSEIEYNSFNLTTFEMDHTVPVFGLLLNDNEGFSLAYTSDSVPVAEFKKISKKIDVLITEGMVPDTDSVFAEKAKHSTFGQAADLTKLLTPKQAFMVHLRPSYFEQREYFEKKILDEHSVNLIFPSEGKTYIL